ncbi:MAG TPA: DUF4350 domain-containing protein [Polyangiaceae bacterium]|nr:DUF4350 domain-containing protein [Polyangiaceae bacterium]
MALCIAFFAATAGAAFEPKDATWQGTSELVAIAREKLGKGRVRIVASIPWEEMQPMDALLVLHPERELDCREVAAFLAAGGRLGLLDDYGSGDSLLRRFRIHRVRAPLDPRDPLRNNPNLPIAVPSVGPDSRPHPVVGGVDRVVTNHPTGLETDRGLRLTTVLELPSLSEPPTPLALIGVIGDAKRCGLVSDGMDEPATTTTAPVAGRCGRLLAMGDPSAVMNLMLRYPGNRAFAARLVEYLVGDDTWGRRSGNLYIVANDFTERGTYGKHGGFMGALDERLEALARLVAETRRDGLPAALAILLGALSAGGATLWAISRATRKYRKAAPRYARPTPLVAQGGLAGRAAVLSAETTHRALVVLELKAALEEAVRERMGIPDASLPWLAEEIDRQDALSRRNSDALRQVVTEMARAEAAVSHTERIAIPDAAIRKMHETVTGILAELDERRRKHP